MLTQKTATRPFGRYSLSRGALFATALVAGLLSAASPSYADLGIVNILSVEPGEIEVDSNGNDYTVPAIPLISLTAQLNVRLDAGISGRVKSWKAWVKVKPETGFWSVIWKQFENDAAQASYSIPRPKKVNTTANISVPYSSLVNTVNSYCNSMADSLREQGLSNEEIFDQDRVITIQAQGALSYKMSGLPGPSHPEEYTAPQYFDVGRSRRHRRPRPTPRAPFRMWIRPACRSWKSPP